jgi:hypothetical protein
VIAEELTPEARDEALRAARFAAMKAAKGLHRAAFEKARARRRLAERAAFFTDDDTDEAQEMADVMEFDDQGGDE